MIDKGKVEITAQVTIRDPDSDETLVRTREFADDGYIRTLIARFASDMDARIEADILAHGTTV